MLAGHYMSAKDKELKMLHHTPIEINNVMTLVLD